MQNKTRTIQNLAAAIMRDMEIASDAYKRKGANLERLRALGIAPGDKIGPLKQRKRGPAVPQFVTLVDNLIDPKTGDERAFAYRSHRFDRFSLEEFVEPKERNPNSRTSQLEDVVAQFLKIETTAPASDAGSVHFSGAVPADLIAKAKELVEPKPTPRAKKSSANGAKEIPPPGFFAGK